jgi:hypothetical protein
MVISFHWRSACFFVPSRRSGCLFGRAWSRASRCSPLGRRPGATFDAAPQGVHEIDDFGLLGLLRRRDAFDVLLLFQQILQRVLVVVLELVGMEVAGLRFDNVTGEIEHVLGHFFVRDVVEIVLRLSHFVRVAQRAFYDLVALDDIVLIDLVACVLIHLAVADAVAADAVLRGSFRPNCRAPVPFCAIDRALV